MRINEIDFSIYNFHKMSTQTKKLYVYYEQVAKDIEGPELMSECTTLTEAWEIVHKDCNMAFELCSNEDDTIPWDKIPIYKNRKEMEEKKMYYGKFTIPETYTEGEILWILVDSENTYFVCDISPQQWYSQKL